MCIYTLTHMPRERELQKERVSKPAKPLCFLGETFEVQGRQLQRRTFSRPWLPTLWDPGIIYTEMENIKKKWESSIWIRGYWPVISVNSGDLSFDSQSHLQVGIRTRVRSVWGKHHLLAKSLPLNLAFQIPCLPVKDSCKCRQNIY